MKNKVFITLGLISSLSLGGCETMGGAWAKRSSIAFQKDSGGSLSVWNADMSAAVGYQDGSLCMQRALAIKTIDSEVAANLTASVSKIADVASTATESDKPKITAALASSLEETASLLTTSTERTTFLDLGLFYICQISANGGITDKQTAELIKIISLSGAAIKTDKTNEFIDIVKNTDLSDGENKATPKSKAGQ